MKWFKRGVGIVGRWLGRISRSKYQQVSSESPTMMRESRTRDENLSSPRPVIHPKLSLHMLWFSSGLLVREELHLRAHGKRGALAYCDCTALSSHCDV